MPETSVLSASLPESRCTGLFRCTMNKIGGTAAGEGFRTVYPDLLVRKTRVNVKTE